MKKTFTLCFVLLFLYSCKKDRFYQQNTNNALQNQTVLHNTLTPGDGGDDAVGYGINITKSFITPRQVTLPVINIAAFEAAHPTRLERRIIPSQNGKRTYAENAKQFIYRTHRHINPSVSINEPTYFTDAISVAFNNALTANNKYDAKYIYADFKMQVPQKNIRLLPQNITNLQNYLTPAFIADINSKTVQEIVETYGTHVLTNIITGAQLQIMFQAETKNQNRELASEIEVENGLKQHTNVIAVNNYSSELVNQNFNRKMFYKTIGGNINLALEGSAIPGQNNFTINYDNWLASCSPANAVLIDIAENGLIIIYDLIADPVKKAALKLYVDQYLLDNQVSLDYIPVNVNSYYNRRSKDHYYTTNSGPLQNYIQEAPTFKALNYPTPIASAVYSYYSPKDTDHYYTLTNTQINNFNYEGVAFYAFSTQQPNTVPIYRYYHPVNKDHYLMKINTTMAGWRNEGIAFYAY